VGKQNHTGPSWVSSRFQACIDTNLDDLATRQSSLSSWCCLNTDLSVTFYKQNWLKIYASL